VDPVARGKDVPLHLGIPPAGLMSKVDTRFEQLLECNEWHANDDLPVFSSASLTRPPDPPGQPVDRQETCLMLGKV
jgi:hypothetical protein